MQTISSSFFSFNNLFFISYFSFFFLILFFPFCLSVFILSIIFPFLTSIILKYFFFSFSHIFSFLLSFSIHTFVYHEIFFLLSLLIFISFQASSLPFFLLPLKKQKKKNTIFPACHLFLKFLSSSSEEVPLPIIVLKQG